MPSAFDDLSVELFRETSTEFGEQFIHRPHKQRTNKSAMRHHRIPHYDLSEAVRALDHNEVLLIDSGEKFTLNLNIALRHLAAAMMDIKIDLDCVKDETQSGR
jgi:hypothetical protein